MRNRLIITFLMIIFMLFIPFISVKGDKVDIQRDGIEQVIKNVKTSEKPVQETVKPRYSESAKENSSYNSFKILDLSTQEIINVPDKDFIYGAVPAEMPLSFQNEALKAQAVASYTYFCRVREKERMSPSEKLKGADFSADLKNHQFYISKEQLKIDWGDSFKSYYDKLYSVLGEIVGEALATEDDNLILAAYHAISAGNTEKSSDVFGGELNYLTAVPSPGDLFAPNYKSTVSISAEEFKSKIEAAYPNAALDSDVNSWIGEAERTPSGMVKKINIGGINVPGSDVRSIFSLRSSDFEIVYSDGNFTFTVFGYGHGVGMSQYGAEYMAKQGASYREILSWYYPKTKIKKII